MYNEEQKKRYLAQCKYEDDTKTLITSIFNRLEKNENFYEKDVCQFIRPEVVDLLKSFNSKSPLRLQGDCIYLKDYYDWCIIEGLADNVVNPFDQSEIMDIIDELIPKEMLNQKFFTKEDLLADIFSNVPDPCNQFLPYAIFSGVKGDKYVELINLRIEDLDKEAKTLKLITGRTIEVDDIFIKLMVAANNSDEYFKDGIPKDNTRKNNEYCKTGYIFRVCNTSKDGDGIVSYGFISIRLLFITSQCDNKFISASTLYKNGLVNHVKKRYAEQNISLKDAILAQDHGKKYTYDSDTDKYIHEFGSIMLARMFRRQVGDYIDQLS